MLNSIPQPEDKYVAIGEASEVLGWSITTLRRWKAEGKLIMDERFCLRALAIFTKGENKNGHVSWGSSEPRLDIVARCRRVLLGEETSPAQGKNNKRA